VQQHSGGVEDGAERGGGAGQRVERGVDDVGRGQRALPHGLLRGDHRGLHPLAPQAGGDVGQPRVGQHRVGARHSPARIHQPILVFRQDRRRPVDGARCTSATGRGDHRRPRLLGMVDSTAPRRLTQFSHGAG
jgi:hypothetical protein